MKLTEEQKKTIEPKIINKRCPICGSKRLIFNDTPGQIMFYPFINEEGTDIDLENVGWINVLYGECKDCGYIIMYRLDKLLERRNDIKRQAQID